MWGWVGVMDPRGGFCSPSSSPEHHISLLWVLTCTPSGRTSEHAPGGTVVWGGGLPPPQLCKAPSVCPTAPPHVVLQGKWGRGQTLQGRGGHKQALEWESTEAENEASLGTVCISVYRNKYV